MAFGSSSDITPVLTTAYGPELNRTWNRLGNTASKCIEIRPGKLKQCFFAASTGGSSVSVVAEGSDVNSSEYDQDNVVNLSLSRGIYRTAFSLSHSEVNMARLSPMSPEPLQDLTKERFFNKITTLWSRINKDIIQGTGTDPTSSLQCIQGLESSLLTSGSYAGASLSTYPGLASNVSGADGSPAALTLAQMDQDLAALYIACGERPDFIQMHPYVLAKFKALAQATQTIMAVNGAQIGIQNLGGEAMEFNNVVASFNGIPIVEDKDGYVSGSPGNGVGHILYLKKRTLVLDYLPYEASPEALNEFNLQALNSNGEMTNSLPFMLHVYQVAQTGSAYKWAIEVEAQFKVLRANANGVRKGVSI